jgi:AcrR family transcriptional regulator
MSPSSHPAEEASPSNAALREKLVDAASRLLASRQVSGITTRDIARAAGLSDGVLYNYFQNKNDLLATALLRGYGEQVELFASSMPVAGTQTVETNLAQFAESMMTLVDATLPVVAGLVAEPELMHRFIADIHGEEYGPQRALGGIEAYLSAEQRLGRLGDFDASAAATLFIGSMITLGIGGVLGGQQESSSRAQVPALIATLLGGLAV